jgi:hypothetical protein
MGGNFRAVAQKHGRSATYPTSCGYRLVDPIARTSPLDV